MRFLQIGYDSYWWQMGKTCVVIHDTDKNGKKDKKHVVPLTILCGLSWDNIERGRNKGYFQVTPKLIRNHIKEHNL